MIRSQSMVSQHQWRPVPGTKVIKSGSSPLPAPWTSLLKSIKTGLMSTTPCQSMSCLVGWLSRWKLMAPHMSPLVSLLTRWNMRVVSPPAEKSHKKVESGREAYRAHVSGISHWQFREEKEKWCQNRINQTGACIALKPNYDGYDSCQSRGCVFNSRASTGSFSIFLLNQI